MDLVVVPTPRGLLAHEPAHPSGRLIPWAQAAQWVREREEDRPRWVWPDTASGYPLLLASDVRVQRCHDLRLCHAILAMAVPEPWPAPTWLTPPPAPPASTAPTLLDDLTLDSSPALTDVVGEHQRQLAAMAAAPDPGRLRLLLAAESAGATGDDGDPSGEVEQIDD